MTRGRETCRRQSSIEPDAFLFQKRKNASAAASNRSPVSPFRWRQALGASDDHWRCQTICQLRRIQAWRASSAGAPPGCLDTADPVSEKTGRSEFTIITGAQTLVRLAKRLVS
jgi:hypothetical protein